MNGKRWTVRKGKEITVKGPTDLLPGQRQFGFTGILKDITDSTITLKDASSGSTMTYPIKDIGSVTMAQSMKAENAVGTLIALGLIEALIIPLSALTPNEEYHYSFALSAYTLSIVVPAAGLIASIPYNKSYRIRGVCRTKDQIYIGNGNHYYKASLAWGIGPSYGGIGFRYQARFGGISGIGLQAGAGLAFPYPAGNELCHPTPYGFSFLAGVKCYPYRGYYVGVQFGNFGRLAHCTLQEGQWVPEHYTIPYGFVFTGGADWFFGNTVGMNLGGGVAIDLTAPAQKAAFGVIDLGVTVKF